jgi:hypothetical protein
MPLTLPARPPAGDTTNWDVDLEAIFQAIKTFVDGLEARVIPPQAIGRRRMWTRAEGAGGINLPANGVEQGVGLFVPKQTIDRIGIEVSVAGTAASTFRIGLRPFGVDGSYGAPVIDQSFALDSTGMKENTVNIALAGGAYALTWTKIGDTGNTGKVQGAVAGDQQASQFFGIGSGTGWPASGHSIITAQLNSGVTGALPGTVTQADQNTNTPNEIPMVVVRRSA